MIFLLRAGIAGLAENAMQSWYAAPRTGERTVLNGRMLLAALALAGLTAAGGPYLTELYFLGFAYLGYGASLLVWNRRLRTSRHERRITHVVDVAFVMVYVAVSGVTSAPVPALVLFCVLSAAIRLGLAATSATAALLVLYFVSASLWFAALSGLPSKTVVMPGVQLAVVATLMVAVAVYLRRLREDLTRLASWNPALASDVNDLISDLLERVTSSLECPRAVMVWAEEEEPWTYVGTWAAGSLKLNRFPPGRFEPLVDGTLAAETFFCEDASQRKPRILYYSGRQQGDCQMAVSEELRQEFQMRSLISFPLAGVTFRGRVFCLERFEAGHDDLRLAIILGRMMTAELDHYYLSQLIRHAAVAEDRIRVARDLHDGLLQSLTAATLQVQVARKLIAVDPGRADRLLDALHDDVTRAHEDLRAFIRTLRPGAETGPDFSLDARLRELSSAIERQWGTPVTLSLDSIDARVPEQDRKAAFQLVREAVTNAAKHAEAATITVECAADRGGLELTVADDGKGFAFRGTFTLAELVALKRGPRTLKERLVDLGGDMSLESSERGSTLHMRLPIQEAVT